MINRFNIQKYTVGHPFGEDMKTNVSSTKKMAKDFISIASRDLASVNNFVLICMGSSGAIVATVFYNAIHTKYKSINISLCHVKKENEECHGERISGLVCQVNTLYVWVDDFIESGETIEMCLDSIRNFLNKKGVTKNLFKFDYVVCSTINPNKCNVKSIEKMTNNIIYNYL